MIGEEEKQAVLRVMERGILSGYQGNYSDAFWGGPEVVNLEKEWAEYFGVKHAICCNSATSGLWLACAAIGLTGQRKQPVCTTASETFPIYSSSQDEVIVTPYSMTCSASIPLHFGAKPVFADIEHDYFCLDPISVYKRINEETKAIIVVDLFGQPYDREYINEIARRQGEKYGHKIYVIEDAAQAVGAKYKDKFAGTLGDIGVFSLNAHKHIQCGEGGVVVTDDDVLATKLRLLMNHAEAVINDTDRKGFKIVGDINLVGLNLRMTELQAAIAREQLKKLDSILEKVRRYGQQLPVLVRDGCQHAYYRFAWTSQDSVLQWDTLTKLDFKDHYITPIYKMPLFRQLGYSDNLCPVCEEVDKNITLAWLKETP